MPLDADIKEFQELYLKEYGIKLNKAQAVNIGPRLVRLAKIVYGSNIPKQWIYKEDLMRMRLKPTKPKLKLINYDGILGYTLSNIKKVLGKEEYDKFTSWIDGQTVAVYKKDKLVYQHDFDRYLLGLPIID